MSNIKTGILLTVVFPVTLVMGGCRIDLKNVQKLATQGSATASLYPEIIRDLYDSCIRSFEYQFPAQRIPIISPTEAITGISLEESEFLNNCENKLLVIENNENRKERIDTKTGLNSPTKAVILSEILKQYFDEIGNLAGANVNFSQETSDLSAAVRGLPGIATSPDDQAQLNAGFSLIGFALKLVSEQIRNKTLKREITKRNGDVSKVVEALEDTITTYKTQLFIEETQVNDFYGGALNTVEGKSNFPSFRLLETLIKSNWIEARSILREKEDIANLYIVELKKLRAHHSKVSELLASITSERKLTDEEHKKINELLNASIHEIRPVIYGLQKDFIAITSRESILQNDSKVIHFAVNFSSDEHFSTLELNTINSLISQKVQ